YLGRVVQSRLVWRRFFRPVTAHAVAVRPFRLVPYRSRLFVLLVRPPLSPFISSRRPAGSPYWPREHDGFHTPSIECLLDARALRADARNRNSVAANKKHPFSDGCAGADVVCYGCRDTARAPRGSKHHRGAAELGRSGKSSSRRLFAR